MNIFALWGPPCGNYSLRDTKDSSISKTFKCGVILPLFKGKGAKANNKDNYRGITLLPTIYKIYEILNKLETYEPKNNLFLHLQFGFQEGVGCTEASFTILEKVNHMLERGSEIFGCLLAVRKAFDTVWIDFLLCKLFQEFDIKGRMWLLQRIYAPILQLKFYMTAPFPGL